MVDDEGQAWFSASPSSTSPEKMSYQRKLNGPKSGGNAHSAFARRYLRYRPPCADRRDLRRFRGALPTREPQSDDLIFCRSVATKNALSIWKCTTSSAFATSRKATLSIWKPRYPRGRRPHLVPLPVRAIQRRWLSCSPCGRSSDTHEMVMREATPAEEGRAMALRASSIARPP